MTRGKRYTKDEMYSMVDGYCETRNYTNSGVIGVLSTMQSRFLLECNHCGVTAKVSVSEMKNNKRRLCKCYGVGKPKIFYGYFPKMKSSMDYIYVMFIGGLSNETYKVGRTFDLQRRLQQIQTENENVELIYSKMDTHKNIFMLETEFNIEHDQHRYEVDICGGTEVYQMPLKEIIDFIEERI